MKLGKQKHHYIICINGGSKENEQTYQFGQTKGIKLFIEKQKAAIEFWMQNEKTQEELIQCSVKIFPDAYRRLYLLHLLQQAEVLKPSKLSISIDGKEKIYDEHTPNFPFMRSMIDGNIKLNPAWKDLSGFIIQNTKTKIKKDLRYSAMSSYLTGINRTYEIDKFSNYWTAMNAFYSYRIDCYKRWLGKNYHADKDDMKALDLAAERQKIDALIWVIDKKDRRIEERGGVKEKNRGRYQNITEELARLDDKEIQSLYERSRSSIGKSEKLPEKYPEIEKRAEEQSISVFSLLLLNYAYDLRCKYVHGERSSLLFTAYNDKNLRCLKAVNYYLQRFLNEEIPKMFREDFWTQEEQKQTEDYVLKIKKTKDGRRSKAEEALEKLRQRGTA